MRGKISREGSYTLGVEWCTPFQELDCDSCQGTISGEVYAITPPKEAALVLCRTCAHELQGDLEYALR